MNLNIEVIKFLVALLAACYEQSGSCESNHSTRQRFEEERNSDQWAETQKEGPIWLGRTRPNSPSLA